MRPVFFLACLLWTNALAPSTALAQKDASLSKPGYVMLDAPREEALARSAAPAHVSRDAALWLLVDGAFREVSPGSNGNACVVMRSFPESVEPVCYDAEGAKTILQIEIRRFQLRNAGHDWTAIDRMIRAEIDEGRLAVPSRPALAWMMSPEQILFGDDGTNVGAWKPHTMLYMPGVTGEGLGLGSVPALPVMVTDPGTPTAFLMTLVPEFTEM
jgi:hypothetical protein